MSKIQTNAPPVELSLSVVRRDMSPIKRWLYRTLLVVVGALIAALLSMWVTEPEAIPITTHVAFAAMTAIGIGWIGVLTWLLVRRHDSTAVDKIATSGMAIIACTVSLVLSVAIALMRGNNWAAIALAISGLFFLGVAIWLLRCGYDLRSRLLASLKELKKASPNLLCMMTACALLASASLAPVWSSLYPLSELQR